MPVGDYTISIVTKSAAQYELYVDLYEAEPALNHTSLTITAGMKETLTVDNTDEKITWKSSKKSVATVSKKGVVTAKKKGSATITATTESGKVLKCKVTVKENKYTETKMKVGDVWPGNSSLQVYSASYNSKGDLVLKCRFVNNIGWKVTALEDLKIKFVTAEGKHIGTYSTSKKSVSVASGSVKDFTVTIKKSKLKIKKADLRNATCTVSGTSMYTRYYY